MKTTHVTLAAILALTACKRDPAPAPAPAARAAARPTALKAQPRPDAAPTRAPAPDGSAAAKPNTASKDPFALMNGEAIGELRIAMPAARARALLGEPKERSKIDHEAATGDYVQTWTYPRRGLRLVMASGERGGPQKIASVHASAPCALVTRRGIRIGSPASSVRRLYAAEQEQDGTAPSDETFVAGSVYGGLIFTFAEGRVSTMFLGAAAE